MDLLVNTVRDFCLSQGTDKTYWVGYSGGLDSHVLLHILAALRSELSLQIHVVHINHGLSRNAKIWAKHCAMTVAQLDQAMHYTERTLSLTANETNLEEIARENRYQIFSELLQQNDVLLTAHHQDDQAETVLLQMLRGSGPKGLAAMPRIKRFAQGLHARPFLNFTRDDLQRYAHANRLKWIDDESNANVNFSRNFLRHEIVPVLKKRWPSVSTTLARVAENCAEAQELLDELAAQDLMFVLSENSLSVKKLLELNPARQRNVLRVWLQRLDFPIPSSIKLQQIQQDMLHARIDKTPHVAWEGIELRRYRDNLYAMPCLHEHDSKAVYEWDLTQSLLLPKIGTLSANSTKSETTSHGLFHADIKTVSVRFRQGGELFQLPGRNNRHDLKKLFQEWGVPPWLRERVPLIFVNEKLAAVVGYSVSHEFVAKGDEGYKLELRT